MFGCFARHRDGAVDCSRTSRALACRLAPTATSRVFRAARRGDGDEIIAFSRHSRLHLGVYLWRRRCSVASSAIATAWWTARTPLALACRLTPPAPSRISRAARRHEGSDSLHPRAIRGCISACGSSVVGLRSLRSSPRRPGGLLARLSRSRVGSRLPHCRAPLALLVTAMIRCILAPFAVAIRRVPLVPSMFGCFARHRDGAVDCSRASRARVSAHASRAVAPLSRRSSSRRRWFVAFSRLLRLYLGVCLWRRRPFSVTLLVVATA